MERTASKQDAKEDEKKSSSRRSLLAIPGLIVSVLDWLVSVAERLVVLAIACVVFYTGWLAFSGASSIWILSVLSENWKALLLLLIPLFYRTIRTFLEEVQKFAGMERAQREKHAPDSDKET
jgi:hypothetical protein